MDEKQEQLQKQNVAALYAVAEMLQKMDDRANEADEERAKEKEEKELELAKAQNVQDTQNLVQAITKQVVSEISKATMYGEKENLELNADKTRDVTHKEVFYAEGGDEDKQVAAKDRNKTEEIQQPLHAGETKSLQLMIKSTLQEELPGLFKHFLKEHEAQYAGNADEDAPDVQEEVMEEPGEDAMDMDRDAEGSSEYPMEEEEYDQDTFKMIKGLKKQLDDSLAAIPDMVMKKAQELSEAQLLKSGFRKEQNKQPQITKAMGLDETDYAIQKSQNTKENVSLDNYSFSALYNAKMKRDAGIDTDNLPEGFFRG